ncbi:7823_t:CDS:2, partial [Cetraspora pellucida]
MNQQEIRKNSANACNECVKAKRKCESESNFPHTCKRCVGKNLPCTYSNKKKRGPKPNSVTEKYTIASIIKSDPPNDFEIIEVGNKAYIKVEITPEQLDLFKKLKKEKSAEPSDVHSVVNSDYITKDGKIEVVLPNAVIVEVKINHSHYRYAVVLVSAI